MPRTQIEQVESYVEKYFVAECNKYRALCIKNQNKRGFMDRTVFWWFGVVDLVELKRPKGGQFEPLQLRYHDKLRKMGHTVMVLNTREQVDDYIRQRVQYGRKVGVVYADTTTRKDTSDGAKARAVPSADARTRAGRRGGADAR